MEPTPPAAPRSSTGVNATIVSVIALVVGFGVAVALLVTASLLSLCSLWGEECTAREQSKVTLALGGAVVVFLGVPGLVALARRDATWLLAPVVELALLVVAVGIWGLA